MTVMWQALSISKEAFHFLSMAKMIAVGMDAKNTEALSTAKWRLLSGEVVIKFVLEQKHNSFL